MLNSSSTQQFSLLDTNAGEPTISVEGELNTHQIAEDETTNPSLNDLFSRYTDYVNKIDELAIMQQEFEKALLGESVTETPDTQGLRQIASKALSRLIHRAQREFAPSGGKLEIDAEKALRATGQEDWDNYARRNYKALPTPEDLGLDLDKLWAYLEKTYGGDGGKNEGYRQLAATIVKRFEIADDPKVTRSSSAVVISMRVYSEKVDYGADKGKYRVGIHWYVDVRKLFQALSCFAEKEGFDDLALALQPDKHALGDYGTKFALREKVHFPGLDVVFFKEKWEFKFSHQVADKLMLFLGEFASIE